MLATVNSYIKMDSALPFNKSSQSHKHKPWPPPSLNKWKEKGRLAAVMEKPAVATGSSLHALYPYPKLVPINHLPIAT